MLAAQRISWPVAPPLRFEHEEIEYLGIPMSKDRGLWFCDFLPTEFFSHQLMEIDAEDTEGIINFATEFGFLFHPARYGRCNLCRDFDSSCEEARVEELERLIAASPSNLMRYGILSYISIKEMKAAIEDLQADIGELFRCISKSDTGPMLDFVNVGSCNPFLITSNPKHMRVTGSLTNAVCNQIIDVVASDRPWKVCKCDKCGRIFKKPQGSSPSKTDKSPSTALYCSTRCRDRQSQRNRRERLKLMK